MMPDQSTIQKLKELAAISSIEDLHWMHGYLLGLIEGKQIDDLSTTASAETSAGAANAAGSNAAGSNAAGSHASASTPRKVTLAYGTETGNAKRLATQLAAQARQRGVNARLVGLDTYRFNDLGKEDHFFVVISTQGEGEPPAPAKKFHELIMQSQPALPDLKYSVLALGDTSYPLFCQTGTEVDLQLEKFGASRVVPIRKCDVDYEADANEWFEHVMRYLQGSGSAATVASSAPPASSANATSSANGASSANATLAAPPPPIKTSSKKYYDGSILSNVVLNDVGSAKQTYHIEIGSSEEIAYECGDTIGIVPHNRRSVVDRIVSLTGIDPLQQVVTPKASGSVDTLLQEKLGICYLMTNTIRKYAAITGHQIPDTRMDLVDLLRIYPVSGPAQFTEVLSVLLPIAPRLYTIASSPSYHGNTEVHITVARDRFMAADEQHYGLCSEFLGDLPTGSPLRFYVHREKNFKMPPPGTDMIMIGPGTGIAPFRSFLAERDSTGATGRNWLFFGEQHFLTDFLYQTEIQNFVDTGVLHRINLAFSRDQASKIYVQHRMLSQAALLFNWIENGAHVYISGTKDPMGKEVTECLLQIIATEGNLDQPSAKQYLDQLEKTNRFQTDIY